MLRIVVRIRWTIEARLRSNAPTTKGSEEARGTLTNSTLDPLSPSASAERCEPSDDERDGPRRDPRKAERP